MKVVVHVASVDEVAAARQQAEPLLQEGDELEVIVAAPVPRAPAPAERQPERQAQGAPARIR